MGYSIWNIQACGQVKTIGTDGGMGLVVKCLVGKQAMTFGIQATVVEE